MTTFAGNMRSVFLRFGENGLWGTRGLIEMRPFFGIRLVPFLLDPSSPFLERDPDVSSRWTLLWLDWRGETLLDYGIVMITGPLYNGQSVRHDGLV